MSQKAKKSKKLSPSDIRRAEARKEKFSLTSRVFILTDLCMWERNKQEGKSAPHAVQVVDMATGQVRYIKSGSKISFVEGDITDVADQKLYNSQ